MSAMHKHNAEMSEMKLVGLKLERKTTNANGQSAKDCGSLWQRFEADGVADQIPGKVSDAVYAVYYDYDSDENGAFSYFIGCRVSPQTQAPKHLSELRIPSQTYQKVTAKGKMTGCITEAWEKIWTSQMPRSFGYDFEVYDQRSHD